MKCLTYLQTGHDRAGRLAVGVGEAVHGQVSPVRRARESGLVAASEDSLEPSDPDILDARLR